MILVTSQNDGRSSLVAASGEKENRMPRDCREVYRSGQREDGVYLIDPGCGQPFLAYCDMLGGQYIVFQRRRDGRENFNRTWDEYVSGFGDPNREFWLGLDRLNCLTSAAERAELRVDLGACDGTTAYARYSYFYVGNSDTKYKLTISGYSGTAGTSLDNHNGRMFTTRDQDNDLRGSVNCAVHYKANGWWFNSCYAVSLNGPYICGQVQKTWVGIIWHSFRGDSDSLKFTEMKLRF